MKTSILTLAIALAFSFTAAPADAAPTLEDRCKAQVVKTDRKYSMCVGGVAARVLRYGQQTGGQATTINDCDSRRIKDYNKFNAKFAPTLGVYCGMDVDIAAAHRQASLVAAGLAEAANITSDNAAVCTSAGGTYDAGADTCAVDISADNGAVCTSAGGTYDAGSDSCTVDITSDNQDVCETAGGTWGSGTCTAGEPPYNCTIGAMCSAWAATYPADFTNGAVANVATNNYIDHTAASSGCEVVAWTNTQQAADSWALAACPSPSPCFGVACE